LKDLLLNLRELQGTALREMKKLYATLGYEGLTESKTKAGQSGGGLGSKDIFEPLLGFLILILTLILTLVLD